MTKSTIFFLLVTLVACSQVAWATVGTLAPGDRIRVWVRGEPELTVERVLDAHGAIDYPLLGTVGLGGRSPVEAARLIARKLDDGYLREPLVQVDLIGRTRTTLATPEPPRGDAQAAQRARHPQRAAPPEVPSREAPAVASPTAIKVVNARTGRGVGGAAMLLGGMIYQSNRLGQVVVGRTTGQIILLADGYNVVQGPIEDVLRPGAPPRLLLEPVSLVGEVVVKVLDAATRLPLADVEVRLGRGKVRTNAQGIAAVRGNNSEFIEIRLTRRGYRPARALLDFKESRESGEQIVLMARRE